MIEEWRAVRDFPDYQVSNLGRVRRATDAYFYRDGSKPRLRVAAGYVLKPRPTGVGKGKSGYPTVLLPLGGRKFKNMTVHILVCEAFHGPRPSPFHEVAHWDDDNNNSRADNLRWATKAQNTADKIRNGRTQRGAEHRSVKLTEPEVLEIFGLLGKVTETSLAKRFGVSHTSIRQIKTGRAWRWLTGVNSPAVAQNTGRPRSKSTPPPPP